MSEPATATASGRARHNRRGGKAAADSRAQHKKLDRLPENARVTKRPLYRPTIASPYSGAHEQKTIYVSSSTPFLSAVKRAEKLLQLAEKRLVQSATTISQQGAYRRRNKAVDKTPINLIADAVEQEKSRKRQNGELAGEEIVFKGSGKAIGKVLELGLWFQQRHEYVVRVETGTASSIDDIETPERTEDESERTKDSSRIRQLSVVHVFVSMR